MYEQILQKVRALFEKEEEPLDFPPRLNNFTPAPLQPPGEARGLMREMRRKADAREPKIGQEQYDDIIQRMKTYVTAIHEANEDTPSYGSKGMNYPAPARPESVKERVYGTRLGQEIVTELMQQYDLSREAAAGIVGSFDYETGAFKYMQEIKPLIAGSRGGTGYAMWTGPRRDEFERFLQEKGMDAGSKEGNMAFLRHEFENTPEGRVLERLRNVTSADEATRIFTNEFLRPSKKHANMDERIRRANLYMTDMPEGF